MVPSDLHSTPCSHQRNTRRITSPIHSPTTPISPLHLSTPHLPMYETLPPRTRQLSPNHQTLNYPSSQPIYGSKPPYNLIFHLPFAIYQTPPPTTHSSLSRTTNNQITTNKNQGQPLPTSPL